MTIVLPTGSCFDDAVWIIKQLVDKDSKLVNTREFLIVHAICWQDYLGDFAHGWVESDFGKGVAMWCGVLDGKREIFAEKVQAHYRRLNVKDMKKYSIMEAAAEEFRCRHYGPWEKRFIKLTRDGMRSEIKKGGVRHGNKTG